MADNPFARFAAPGLAVAENPFARFASAPDPNVFEGIDLSGDIPAVREAIGKLPEAKRKAALDQWAKVTVARDNAKTGGQGILQGVNNVAEAIARGTPIGSWGDEIDAGLKQAAYNVTGGTIGAPYDETVAYNRARQKDFDDRNPWGSMGLKLGGAVASLPLTPMRASAPGASMLSRMGNVGAQGAAYGALYGAGEGTDAPSRLVELARGAAIGGGVGAAVVPLAAGTGNLAKYVADKYRGLPAELSGMNPQAVQKVTRAATDDGLFPGAARSPPTNAYSQQAAQLGPEGMLADMGPNLLSQTQALTRQPGPGQRILQGAIDDRARGAAGRIAADTDAVLGPARNLVQVEEAATSAARQQAAPLYQQFYDMQIPVNQQLVTLLQRVPQGAWSKVQQLAQAEGVDLAQTMNTGRGIDLIKRGLDDMARNAGPGTNEERVYANLARALRSEVDTLISPQNPAASVWAQARSAAGEGLQFREALDEGRQAFQRGVHPDQMAADLAEMNPLQRGAYREGARGQVRDIMGNATSAGQSPADGLAAATAARKALGSEYARRKLDLITHGRNNVPGRGQPDQLAARLDAETRFADTRNRAWQGSQTSNAMLAAKEFPNAASRREAASSAGQKGPMGLATEAAYRLGNALLGGHLDARNAAQVRDAARMLAAQGVERDEIVRGLRQYAQSRGITAQGREAIMRLSSQLYQTPRSYWISENAAEPNVATSAR